MRLAHVFSSRRVFIAGVLLALGLVAGPLTARGAGATFTTCDLDPTILLSNGATVSVTAHINAQASDINQVTYVVHGPVGTSVVSITYDAGPLGSLESVSYVADGEDNSYSASALVDAAEPNVGVTTSVSVSAPPGGGSGGNQDSGHAGDQQGDSRGHHGGGHGDDSGHGHGHG